MQADAGVLQWCVLRNVGLSEKEGSRLAPALQATSIGGCFVPEEGHVEPTREALRGFGKEAVALLEGRRRGEKVAFERADSFVGLMGWIARFVKEGALRVFFVRRWKMALKFQPGREGKLSGRAEGEIRWMLDQLAAARFVKLVDSPRYAYPLGGDSVASDASSDGWGIQVGPFIAYGSWGAETVAALARVKKNDMEKVEGGSVLSISPAELFVVNLLLLLVHKVGGEQLCEVKRFVARCDNLSACAAVNHRRVRSVPMHAALVMLVETEGEVDLKIRLEHIRTQLNVVPDLLSRGRIEDARRLVAERWGVCEVVPFQDEVVERLESALCASCVVGYVAN